VKIAGLLLALVAMVLPSQGESVPVFQVEYSNPDLSPSHWAMTIRLDGNGHFQSQRGRPPTQEQPAIDPPSVDRDIKFGEEFVQRIFEVAQNKKLFKGDCESHLKVAFQGWKKISYSGPEGSATCEFNYSKDKEIQALSESLVAVATTIVEGAKLESLLQHDRLGLDREMEYLAEAVNDGRAQQIGAIQGILERLADDPSVMERVRKRAKVLLAAAEK
jgi:hypothetical protein